VAVANPTAENDPAHRLEQRLQWPLLIAALLTVPAIVIEQSSAGQPWDDIAVVLNWATWLAFAGELGDAVAGA
jgi:hypothetical protein